MVYITMVFHSHKAVNATVIQDDDTIKVFQFPVKIPHFKFLYNGNFYCHNANQTTLAAFLNYVRSEFIHSKIIVFYKRVEELLGPNLDITVVPLSVQPISHCSHYQIPYHTVMTCSYCLCWNYVETYKKLYENNGIVNGIENNGMENNGVVNNGMENNLETKCNTEETIRIENGGMENNEEIKCDTEIRDDLWELCDDFLNFDV